MIEIKNLSIHKGDFSLNDINLAIGDREYFVILGPTGAGKSHLARRIYELKKARRQLRRDFIEIT